MKVEGGINMKMDHKRETQSPLKMQAREGNILKILDALANKPQDQEGRQLEALQPTAPQGSRKPMESLPEKKPVAQPSLADEIPPEAMEAQSFDQEGNFVPPPVEGYWLSVLEKRNAEDPAKTGPDWRDEAIANFKQARERIGAMEEELMRMQGGMGIGRSR